MLSRSENRKRRHFRVRNKISGTTAIPRLNVFKSNSHFYAQIIDDQTQTTLVSSSTLKLAAGETNNIAAAQKIGSEIAKKAITKNITQVVFDRGGYLYHGKVKAFAEAARAAGLKF